MMLLFEPRALCFVTLRFSNVQNSVAQQLAFSEVAQIVEIWSYASRTVGGISCDDCWETSWSDYDSLLEPSNVRLRGSRTSYFAA